MSIALLTQATEAVTGTGDDRLIVILVSIIGSLVAIVIGQITLMLKGDIITRKQHLERLADRDLVTEFWKERALNSMKISERVVGTVEVTNRVLDATARYIAPDEEVT